MQQQELGLKAKEVEIKEKKMAIDAAAKNDQMDIERERIASQERIAGLQVGAKVATSKEQMSADHMAEGLRIGVQVARDAAQQGKQQPAAGANPLQQAVTESALTGALQGIPPELGG